VNWSRLVPELAVSNLETSIHFYTQILGFTLAYRRSEPVFAYLDLDGAQIMLEEAPSSWPVGELMRPYGRGVNFEIAHPDVAALRNTLVGLQYPLYRDIEETWRETGDTINGSREFLVQDPDGYLLRFAQPLGERAKNPG